MTKTTSLPAILNEHPRVESAVEGQRRADQAQALAACASWALE
ncbi:hypothetical protein PG5_23120 [Pseudomonas sp. G5(2012)]|nr:hypothetical protein PG5_23120 [Pseudomonas sp. G5(2012)]